MSSPHRPVDPRASFPAAGGDGAGALAGARRVRRVGPPPNRRAPVGLLRGATDRQRQPRHPPRAQPGVQGHLPPLPDDDRALRGAQGRMGLPWAAGRAGASRPSWASQSKADIERYGIAEFNARCREKVLSHVAEWNRLTERIGFWLDLDDAYRTLDPSYVESVWWALKTIHDRGLLYEKLKVVPYCPRDEITLSSHELGQPGAYQDVVDPSVYVRLPVTTPAAPRAARRRAAGLDHDPVDAGLQRRGRGQPRARPTSARRTDEGPVQILAEALVERVLGEDAEVRRTFPAARSWSAPRMRRRSPTSRPRPTGPRATRCCRPTSSPRRTAPAWSTRRSRSARTTSASASRRA